MGSSRQCFCVDLGNYCYVLLLLAVGVPRQRREYELVVPFVWGHDSI